jgi:uncharacterized protein (TIGR02453 family)
MTFSGFSPAALDFLRKLKRNNRRSWFQPRKEIYEREIRQPMLELIAAVNAEMMRFAPQHCAPPAKAMMRIYRDTRFSANKAPYKTHVSAIFPRAGADRMSGACFYFHFTEKELLVFAGVWNPPADELRLIRAFLAQNHERLAQLLRPKKVRSLLGDLQGERLSRVPRGFSKEHPAAELLCGKQWYLERTLPARVLSQPNVVNEITKRFRAATPLVDFMNQPLLERSKRRDPLMEALGMAI